MERFPARYVERPLARHMDSPATHVSHQPRQNPLRTETDPLTGQSDITPVERHLTYLVN